ncbi:MAG: hypothetical protein KFF49_13000, partial [Bacteroidales bacterium]|nr:hypothetical protein [Bacteroidales bacterium]
MKRSFLPAVFLTIVCTQLLSQDRQIPVDTAIVTKYTTTINGDKFTYTATTGTQPVYIDDE